MRGAWRRVRVVVDDIEKALVEERCREARPSPGERLLKAQLPAAGVLGLQIGVADRETGRVVLKETWLAEAGAGGRPATSPVPALVDPPQAATDLGDEDRVGFHLTPLGQVRPGNRIRHRQPLDGRVPA